MGEHKNKERQTAELTDQWKLDGQCEKCRRKHYCKKMCKARNDYAMSLLKQRVQEQFPLLNQLGLF